LACQCSVTADDLKLHRPMIRRFNRHLMALLTQTGHHHLLGFSPIQLDLEMISSLHRFQHQPATDEIDRTGGPTEIERAFTHPF
jgi:hypothetical protein